MELLGKTALVIYTIASGIVLVILVVLVFKRMKAKKLEDFDKRDN